MSAVLGLSAEGLRATVFTGPVDQKVALESQEAARADRLAVSSSITVASRAMRAAMSVAFLAWVASNRHGAAAAGDLARTADDRSRPVRQHGASRHSIGLRPPEQQQLACRRKPHQRSTGGGSLRGLASRCVVLGRRHGACSTAGAQQARCFLARETPLASPLAHQAARSREGSHRLPGQ